MIFIKDLLKHTVYAGLFVIYALTFPALAEESENNTEMRPAILEANLAKIESAGLYSRPKNGSLGRDLWANSDRHSVTKLIEALPAPTMHNAAYNMLIWGVLLTKADSRLLDTQDGVLESGGDLLTLRLEKLLEFGAYEQALELYSEIGEEPYHPRLARAGILSMLLNAEKSLACLEYKTIEDRDFEQTEFWKNLNAYCSAVLEDGDKKAPSSVINKVIHNKKYRHSYTSKSLKTLSPLEFAVLVADARLRMPALTKQFIHNAPLRILGLYVHSADLSAQEKFHVLTRALSLGVIKTDVLTKFYETYYSRTLSTAKADTIAGWKRLPFGYHQLKKERKDGRRWAIFETLIEASEASNTAALLPLAPLLKRQNLQGISESTALRAIDIINASGETLPGDWGKQLIEMDITRPVSAFIAYTITAPYRRNDGFNTIYEDALQTIPTHIQDTVKIITENIDKPSRNKHNASTIYEKHLNLTLQNNYVIPTLSVWDRLQKSGKDSQIGITILLSTQILRTHQLDELYPAVVRDVFENINNVGLTNISRGLALQALLDYNNKKGAL